MSFAHPGWLNQQETGRLITLRVGTIWGHLGPFGPFGTIWDHLGSFGTKMTKMTLSDLRGPCGTLGDPFGPLGTLWYIWGPFDTFGDLLVPSGTL